jgi:sugar/nucleoside kinase (ribokinase family)
MKKILTIGEATEDIYLHYNTAQARTIEEVDRRLLIFVEGSNIEVTALSYFAGGGAVNSAVSFSRLGFSTTIHCNIGNDEAGQRIFTTLQQEKIETEFVCYNDHTETGRSFILPAPSGDRTILTYRGSNAHISEVDVPYEIVKKQNILYITALSGSSAQVLLPLTQMARSSGVIVAHNPGSSQVRQGLHFLEKAFSHINILILNRYEAQQLLLSLLQQHPEFIRMLSVKKEYHANQYVPVLLQKLLVYEGAVFDVRDFFSIVFSKGPDIVAVTNGAEGVYCSDGRSLLFHQSLPTRIVSTLGAGDAFGSCFVASLQRKYDMKQALVNGIINATSVISYSGAQEGLLYWSNLEQKAQELGEKFVQHY